MISSGRSSGMNSNVRNRGWTAFDHKHREGHGIGAEGDADPYPSMPQVAPWRGIVMNNSVPGNPGKSFVSVLCPSLEKTAVGTNAVWRQKADALVKKLKEATGWADLDLIEDVLASVDYDELRASNLLESMVSGDPKKVESGHYDREEKGAVAESQPLNCSNEVDGKVAYKLEDGLGSRFTVPVEPEWEEDDLYLNHRRDAIRMTRLASQHSRASNNAYLRGDHHLAHRLSLKAHEEWAEAEELNNKAATEILRCRNSGFDIWRIDLHGLHASEAIRTLNNRLREIESQIMMKRSTSIDGLSKIEKGTTLLHHDSRDGLKLDPEATKKKLSCQRRQSVLHVITGTGNHSRGGASLPAAIKSFLLENAYRFDDVRPGVVLVHPKFRNS